MESEVLQRKRCVPPIGEIYWKVEKDEQILMIRAIDYRKIFTSILRGTNLGLQILNHLLTEGYFPMITVW